MKKNSLLLAIPAFLFLLLTIQCKKEELIIPDDDNQEPPIEDTIQPPPPPPPPVSPYLLTEDELSLINSGDSADAFIIMNYWLQPDSIILRTQSIDVDLENNSFEDLKLLTDRMKTAMIGANGVGIAAPQIGINRNVIWVQRYDKGIIRPYEVYFNPTIISYSGTNMQRQDGCLSVPRTAQWPPSIAFSFRYPTVEVAYYLIDGTRVQETITDAFTAHIFQHEIDHLNGIMYMDRDTQW